MDGNVLRSMHSDSNLVAFNAEHRHGDFVANHQCFPDTPGKY